MSRHFRPRPKDAPYLDEVRVDKHTFQKGSINDPVQQDGVLYLNQSHTSYLYLDELGDLYFQGPDVTATKIN